MQFSLTKVTLFAATVATLTLLATTAPAGAKDWRSSLDRHYDAAEATRFVPTSQNPDWDFTLDDVVADMAWRQRTAERLRSLPRPSADPLLREPDQLADRPETQRLRFSF